MANPLVATPCRRNSIALLLGEIEMAWNLGNSNAHIRRDIEQWRLDLAMWMAAGFTNSSPAKALRAWIAEAEWMIKPLA
jgi:hypothetical protein